MRLALIHRTAGAAPAPAGSTAWRTCLREIHFLSAQPVPLDTGVVTDAEAYALLLEVVCGLRSPLIGETEVQAQFKEFLASPETRDQRWLRRLGQRVLGDAKRIRHKHLQGFGAHSYGRLTARYLTGDRVAVVGTGALASEVIRAAPAEAALDVWGRSRDRPLPGRPESFTFTLISDAEIASRRSESTTLVVAAPVCSNDLNRIAAQYTRLERVVDLRSYDHQTVINRDAPVVPLGDLLAQAPTTEVGGAPRVAAARADIRELATAFVGREQVRPFGWDDVCA